MFEVDRLRTAKRNLETRFAVSMGTGDEAADADRSTIPNEVIDRDPVSERLFPSASSRAWVHARRLTHWLISHRELRIVSFHPDRFMPYCFVLYRFVQYRFMFRLVPHRIVFRHLHNTACHWQETLQRKGVATPISHRLLLEMFFQFLLSIDQRTNKLGISMVSRYFFFLFVPHQKRRNLEGASSRNDQVTLRASLS